MRSIAPPFWPLDAGDAKRAGRRASAGLWDGEKETPPDPWRRFIEAARDDRPTDETCAVLEAIYGPMLRAPQGVPFVVAQLGQSLDGRIATENGSSHYINGPSALDHLHRLRASVDAVVVGVGTVVADDPQLTVRRCIGEDPAKVILDPRGRTPTTARCLKSGGRVIVVRGPDAAAAPFGETLRVALDGEGALAPAAIAAALAALGLHRILVEGGASTVSRFLAAEAVDRLHVAVAPLIIGSGIAGLALPPVAALDVALRPPTAVHVFADGNVLFDCDIAAARRAIRADGREGAEDDATDHLPTAGADAPLADGGLRDHGDHSRDRHGWGAFRGTPEHPV